MRALGCLTAVVVLSLIGLTGCGGGAGGSTGTGGTVKQLTSRLPKDSADGDNDATSDDDTLVLDYGHPASPSEQASIATVVKAYYAAAADEDGREACRLLYPIVAESVPDDYGRPPAPRALRGKTCAVVMSKLFRRHHRDLVAESRTLKVTSVHVGEEKALVVMSFGTTPEPRRIPVHRLGRAWRIMELLDSEMP
jgi:hypothetical protein